MTVDGELLGRDSFEPLIPHSGSMCLLDRVVAWKEDMLWAESSTHLRADNPLRQDGRIRAVHAIEYGAQGMAVHGGLLARATGEPLQGGYLAAIREARFHCRYLHDLDEPLSVSVWREYAQAGNLIYRFEVVAGLSPVADGKAIVVAT